MFPGGPVPPLRPEVWLALPPQQREALLSFAISNLADLLGDSEARSQIQRIAADAVSRAVSSARIQRPALSQAQKDEMNKARKLTLRR